MRFSLRSLLVVVLIVGLLVTSGFLAWELSETRGQLDAIRNKHGELVVRNKSRVHVRMMKEDVDGLMYKFDVFIPEGQNYLLAFAVRDIPAEGESKDRRMLAKQLVSGVNEISVKKFKRGQDLVFEFQMVAGETTLSNSVSIPAAEWMPEGGLTQSEYWGSTETDVMDPDPVISLIRLHTTPNPGFSPGLLMELIKKK